MTRFDWTETTETSQSRDGSPRILGKKARHGELLGFATEQGVIKAMMLAEDGRVHAVDFFALRLKHPEHRESED